MNSACSAVTLLSALAVFASWVAQAQSYSATGVDSAGQLHISLQNGAQVLAPRLKDQQSFDSAAISPDHHTVGWLVLYPDPVDAPASSLAGTLVLYRGGRILRRFQSDQVFWDWIFVDDNRVAYSTGPTHGGAAECVLRNIESGAVLARWAVTAHGSPPRWAGTLRR